MSDLTIQDSVLTLRIPISVYAKTGSAVALCDAETSLERSGFEDGRYPFDREMFCQALSMMLRRAAFDSALRMMKLKHGENTMVKTGENSQTNLAYLKTEEWMHNDLAGIHVSADDWEVELKHVID